MDVKESPLDQYRGKCLIGGPLCIADHSVSNYCIQESTGLLPVEVIEKRYGVSVEPPAPIPEALSTLPDAVQPESTLTTPKPHGFAIGDDFDLNRLPHRVTNILSETSFTYELMTPEKFLRRWNATWLNGIKFDAVIRTGRRVDNKRAIVTKSTKRILPRVRACGHKLDLAYPPRHRDCDVCWTAYFRNQPEFSENLAKSLSEQGPEIIIHNYGRKFLQQFTSFAILLSSIEAAKAAYAEQEKNEHESMGIHPVNKNAESSSQVG